MSVLGEAGEGGKERRGGGDGGGKTRKTRTHIDSFKATAARNDTVGSGSSASTS